MAATGHQLTPALPWFRWLPVPNNHLQTADLSVSRLAINRSDVDYDVHMNRTDS